MDPSEPALVEDFRDLLVAFVDAEVEFVVVGGWALALHGYARGTDDLDIFVRASPGNASRVFRALAAFGAPVAAHGVTESLFAQEGYGYRMGVKPNLIEVLTSIDGVDFDEAARGTHTFNLEGRAVPFIGRAILMKNKRAAGRPKETAPPGRAYGQALSWSQARDGRGPLRCAEHARPKKAIEPHLAAAGNGARMREAKRMLRDFRGAYRAAWAEFQKGAAAVFPYGTLRMKRVFGVATTEPFVPPWCEVACGYG